MKSLKPLILAGIVLGTTLLFTQCRNTEEADQQIPYNKEKAQVHFITVDEATQLTSTFRRGRIELSRQLKDSAYLNNSFNLPLAEEFNRDAIAALLNQKGAKGMRIYLGKDTKGLIKLVLVAVDDKDNDITGRGKIVKLTNSAAVVVLEAGQRCPTLCSTSGSLD